MNIEDIYKIIEKIDKSSLSYFEMDMCDCKVKIDKSLDRPTITEGKELIEHSSDDNLNKATGKSNIITSKPSDDSSDLVEVANSEIALDDENVYIVKSPIVGTYYDSPSPDSDKYVTVGNRVNNGDIVCIIESMKLMNEIESEVSGEVVDILVKTGDMVEFGQPLVKIRRDNNA